MDRLKPEDIAFLAFVMHNIWLRRNFVVFQNKFKAPQLVQHEADREREEFLLANVSELPSTTR